MVTYYVDHRWYRDIPPCLSGGGTLVVAASNSLHPERADYQCDGNDDEYEINLALAAVTMGGKVELMEDKIECFDASCAIDDIAAFDLLGLEFTRWGTHVNDTVNADCYLIGFSLEYV